MKYRLKGGVIEATKHDWGYWLGEDPTWSMNKDTFEKYFETNAGPNQPPRPPPGPESEWATYAYALRADRGSERGLGVGVCRARSDDEAYGIAHYQCDKQFPMDTHDHRNVTVIKVKFEDN